MSKFKARILAYSPTRDETLLVDVTGDDSVHSVDSYTTPSEPEDHQFFVFDPPVRSSTPLPGKTI